MILTAGPGYVPPIDPVAAMARGAQLGRLMTQGQQDQLDLAEAQRQAQERGTMARAFHKNVVTDPVTGETRVNIPGAFIEAYRTTSDPLTVFKAQQEYGKSQAASAKDRLEARKVELETAQKRTEYVSRLANGLLTVEAQGGDVQAAYQQVLTQAARDLGVDQIPGLPPTYDRSTVLNLAARGQTYTERIQHELDRTTQQLREREVQVREAEVPLIRAKTQREEREARGAAEVQRLEPPAEAPGAAVVQEPAPKTMSEADIAEAMRQTGKTRAEVVRRAHERGWRTPDRTAPVPAAGTPASASAPATRAPAPAPAAPAPAPAASAPAPAAPPGTAAMAPPAAAAPAAPVPAYGAAPPAAQPPGVSPAPEGPPASPAPDTPASPAPVSPRLQADAQRLETLVRMRDAQEQHIRLLQARAGTTEAGKTRLAQAEQELTRRNQEIARLQERIYGPEDAARTTAARDEAQRQQLRGQSTAETLKEQAPLLYDVRTATPVNAATPYGEVLEAQRQGTVRQLSKRQAERLEVAREAVPVLARMQRYVDAIYGEGGELAAATRNDLQQLLAGTLPEGQLQRLFPTLVEAARFVESNASTLARGLKGEVGAMTEGDIERAMAGLPHFRSLFSLGLGFGGGYVPGRGIGPSVTVRPQMRTADTERTARNVLQDTVDILHRTSAAILGQKDFQYDELRRPPTRRPGEPGGAGAGF
jgi:hypothetical protein